MIKKKERKKEVLRVLALYLEGCSFVQLRRTNTAIKQNREDDTLSPESSLSVPNYTTKWMCRQASALPAHNGVGNRTEILVKCDKQIAMKWVLYHVI